MIDITKIEQRMDLKQETLKIMKYMNEKKYYENSSSVAIAYTIWQIIDRNGTKSMSGE